MKIYIEKDLEIQGAKNLEFPIIEWLANEAYRSDIVQLVSTLEESDIVVIPTNIQHLLLHEKKYKFFEIQKTTVDEQKNLLIFSGSDYGKSLPFNNCITIRLGGFNSRMSNKTFIMPPFIDDPYTILNKQPMCLEKGITPTIGFVGHSNGSRLKWVKEFALFLKGNLYRIIGKDKTDLQFFYPSSIKRYQYLNLLSQNNSIETNFIFRTKYRAGVTTLQEREKTTQEFYINMFDNLYTFCLRGTGNFSVRFYETLAMGRIPVLVDTDCRLPFPDTIDWNQHALIIPEQDVKHIGERLLNFHNTKSSEELLVMQKRNRTLWELYFQKKSYFVKLIQSIKNID